MKRTYSQWLARLSWISLIAIEAVCGIITLCALADVLFDFGWGYTWEAVLMGVGIMLWGALVWFVCRAMFRMFGVSEPGA